MGHSDNKWPARKYDFLVGSWRQRVDVERLELLFVRNFAPAQISVFEVRIKKSCGICIFQINFLLFLFLLLPSEARIYSQAENGSRKKMHHSPSSASTKANTCPKKAIKYLLNGTIGGKKIIRKGRKRNGSSSRTLKEKVWDGKERKGKVCQKWDASCFPHVKPSRDKLERSSLIGLFPRISRVTRKYLLPASYD